VFASVKGKYMSLQEKCILCKSGVGRLFKLFQVSLLHPHPNNNNWKRSVWDFLKLKLLVV